MYLATYLNIINSGCELTIVVVSNPKFRVLVSYFRTPTIRTILMKELYIIFHNSSIVFANPPKPQSTIYLTRELLRHSKQNIAIV